MARLNDILKSCISLSNPNGDTVVSVGALTRKHILIIQPDGQSLVLLVDQLEITHSGGADDSFPNMIISGRVTEHIDTSGLISNANNLTPSKPSDSLVRTRRIEEL